MQRTESVESQLKLELASLLQQALDRTIHCVQQLSHEQLWWRPGPDQHSVGIVLRHVTGNLRQWGVAGIRQLRDTRDRTAEFESTEQQTAGELINELREAVADVEGTLETVSGEQWLAHRSIQGFDVSIMGALMHTIPHVVGHTHQIVLLTRMQLGEGYKFHWSPDAPRDVVPL